MLSPSRMWLGFWTALMATALPLAAQRPDAVEQSASRIVSQQCLTCHNTEKPSAGLDLTTRESAMAGGQMGQALVPGDPEASLIYSKVADGQMPFGNPLPPEDREIFRRWVEAGAPWQPVVQIGFQTSDRADRWQKRRER